MTKDKPLSEKSIEMDYTNMRMVAYGSFIPTKDVAEAVKKLKEELENSYIQGLRNWVMRNSHQGYVTEKGLQDFIHNRLRECFKEDIDKIFGEFHSPQENYSEKSRFVSPEGGPHTKTRLVGGKSLSENKTEDTHARGCGKSFELIDKAEAWFDYDVCGGESGLCPKCEVGK